MKSSASLDESERREELGGLKPNSKAAFNAGLEGLLHPFALPEDSALPWGIRAAGAELKN
ncbi:MAG: hypothetical protein WCA20_00490 [Candidatus Sulfotelmatobacter sp.]